MLRLLLIVFFFVVALGLLINNRRQSPARSNDINHVEIPAEGLTAEQIWREQIRKKTERRAKGYSKMDSPDLIQEFHQEIRTREGAVGPEYSFNHKIDALKKASRLHQFKLADNGIIKYESRGPSNVPGRTRGLLVLPGDETSNTWLAGSAGGGIWKTTNAGQSWRFLTPDFPTMAVSTLAMSDVEPNIIYAGTGEFIASTGTAIEGQGIFKSTDGGNTWQQLISTVNTTDFLNITRIIVDPENPNLVLAASAPNNWRRGPDHFISTIMRSEDGGASWTKVFEVTIEDIENNEGTGAIEQLIATPGDFDVLYASMHGFGPYKSTDRGLTWQPANSGIQAYGRVELAVSPVKPDRLFASAEGSLSGTDSDSDLYFSDNAGEQWVYLPAEIDDVPVDFLNGQGWYDNTIACDPFNADIVYAGGVSLFRFELNSTLRNRYILEFNNTDFLSLVNFGADYAGGTLEANEFAGEFDVEIRFGPGISQRAHRYLVPEEATTGVPPDQYYYQDYIEVPFEVWDITNNRQIMAGFRDQDRNGEFNLLPLNSEETTPSTEQSREYIYLSDIPYSETPDPLMAVTGGHEYRGMFFFWPVLASEASWNDGNLPESSMLINYDGKEPTGVETLVVADVYGEFDGVNRYFAVGDVHPDQHNMIMIPVNEEQQTYRILLSNDGGVFYSNTSTTPGIREGDWTFAGHGYVTTQFYGAEKMPGAERFIGGAQDNGTWYSPALTKATDDTDYLFAIGGDGFEVIWHALDPRKMIGGSQFNRFRRTFNAGARWYNAELGITGNSPFISKLENSDDHPEVIFTVSSDGVFRSDNFGSQWNLTPITENWLSDVSSTFLDVEVSNANANIIWAGSGMTDTRNLHYSTDGGRSFKMANNYLQSMGTITKLGSHPLEDSTAYALFSFAGAPKVLRTEDLGQSWEDISGFEGNPGSANGFPDVAVYTIYVRPDNPEIIWVGSEIGIIESLDNGESWHILDEFPNASVWQIRGRDNFLTIATHGRGIWTAEVNADQRRPVPRPVIDTVARVPNGKIIMVIGYEDSFDSTAIRINNNYIGSFKNSGQEKDTVIITGLSNTTFEAMAIAYEGNAPVANIKNASIRESRTPASSFYEIFHEELSTIIQNQFIRQPILSESPNYTLRNPEAYPNNSDLTFDLASPVIVSAENPVISYEDIALVQPGEGNDYVVVEGTIDGLNWLPLSEPYDAGFSDQWTELFETGENPDYDDFIQHEVDLTNTFEVNDTIFIRFRLHSDESINGWGWAVDNIFVQTEIVGLKKKIDSPVKLYPNPVSDRLTVLFNEEFTGEKKLTVLNMQGSEVYHNKTSKQKEEIDVNKYSNGIYFMVIEAKGKKRTYKFVVSH